MPSSHHPQPPTGDGEPPPAPRRRDQESPAAGDTATTMTSQQRALRDAWLSEMWPVCHEESSKGRRPKRRRTAA